MKHIFVALLCANLIGLSAGGAYIKTCDPNDLSERSYSELMIGQTISLVVAADANDLWSGGLFLRGDNRGMGVLSGRGKDPNSKNWTGSCLPNAGNDAFASKWRDSTMWGFDLYNDVTQRTSGDWFVIDYTASDMGRAKIEFYDYDYSWDVPDPNVSLSFMQIPTRDFNDDGLVNLIDFHIFARHWEAAYEDPNDFENTDISGDGYVGLADLVAFSDYWLWGRPEITEPNLVPVPLPDPNLFYNIVDANGLSEITMTVGDSVVLYIDQNSIMASENVMYFDLETDITDPNIGWIDNHPEGTAVILTTPRLELFDYIGAGFVQPEGIEFFAVNFNGISDGPLAAFVYTATNVGDQTLYLVNHSESNAGLIPILIHQVAPPVDAVQVLSDIWASGELNGTTTEEEWDDFISSVEESQTNDPNSVSQ